MRKEKNIDGIFYLISFDENIFIGLRNKEIELLLEIL